MHKKMLEIVNRQRKIGIDAKSLLEFAVRAVELIPAAKERSFTIAFVSDRRMKQLNKSYRGKKETTDVLSFPMRYEEFEIAADRSQEGSSDYLGDIVVSPGRALTQAAENGIDLDFELKQLILHGILHLVGYDHETDKGEMNAKELELRDRLKIS